MYDNKEGKYYIYKDNKLYASATDQDTAIKWFIQAKQIINIIKEE
jgi:hypothetical protein